MDTTANYSSIVSVNDVIQDNSTETYYDTHKGMFWGVIAQVSIFAIVATVGNGLVIYASYGSTRSGPMRYLDNIVKSLAVADMLYASIGTAVDTYHGYLGKCNQKYETDNDIGKIFWLHSQNNFILI